MTPRYHTVACWLSIGVRVTSLRCCVNSIGCQYRDESSSRPACLAHQSITSTAPTYSTYLPTFNSSPSMVVVISAHLPTEVHSLFHAHVPLSATEASLSQDRVCGTVYRLLQDRSPATNSLGNIWKHIYSRPRNCSAFWLLIIVRLFHT